MKLSFGGFQQRLKDDRYGIRATCLPKKAWLRLARLALEEEEYANELDNAIKKICLKHKHSTDFIGTPYDSLKTIVVLVDLLGSEFEYLIYECKGNLETYNANVQVNSTSPNIQSLEEFYDKMVAKEV